MKEDKVTKDFVLKFNKLNEQNKKYIIAIQQALIFSQTSSEKAEATNKK